MSEKDEEALKYLLGLESFPSYYEISKDDNEELEERVTNWQEQIFTLAGELHDVKNRLIAAEKKNTELQKDNQRLKLANVLNLMNARKKYDPAQNALQALKDNQSNRLKGPIIKMSSELILAPQERSQKNNVKDTPPAHLKDSATVPIVIQTSLADNQSNILKGSMHVSSPNIHNGNVQPLKNVDVQPLGETESLDLSKEFSSKKKTSQEIQHERDAKISSQLILAPQEISPKNDVKDTAPDQLKDSATVPIIVIQTLPDLPKINNQDSVHFQELEDKLREALDTISRLKLELISQKEYYRQLLTKELKKQEKLYKELLEKKSYLPISLESLDQSHDTETQDLSFIVDGSNKYIKSGSIRSLVDYLVDPDTSDIRFLQIFIFSYPMYMDTMTLLKMILNKLNQIKDGDDSCKISRIIYILKYWIDNYFIDFENDLNLIVKLRTQFDNLKKLKSYAAMSEMVLKQIDRKIAVSKNAMQSVKITSPQVSSSSNRFRKSSFIRNHLSKKNGILSHSSEDVAKQLTTLDFKYFAAINLREFLELNWMKKETSSLSPGLMQIIKWSNHVAFWVTTEILTPKSVKERVQIMEFMISLANVF